MMEGRIKNSGFLHTIFSWLIICNLLHHSKKCCMCSNFANACVICKVVDGNVNMGNEKFIEVVIWEEGIWIWL